MGNKTSSKWYGMANARHSFSVPLTLQVTGNFSPPNSYFNLTQNTLLDSFLIAFASKHLTDFIRGNQKIVRTKALTKHHVDHHTHHDGVGHFSESSKLSSGTLSNSAGGDSS
jgi:hypothetical protein